ncbi:hypothetical protein H4Q26_009590 [Puccinia striiformis f. sp. tritici PST-130]|nr:hypothetical protein H4Q26_009590 [Puccinia striiformis f. sp. tritici PST-130]
MPDHRTSISAFSGACGVSISSDDRGVRGLFVFSGSFHIPWVGTMSCLCLSFRLLLGTQGSSCRQRLRSYYDNHLHSPLRYDGSLFTNRFPTYGHYALDRGLDFWGNRGPSNANGLGAWVASRFNSPSGDPYSASNLGWIYLLLLSPVFVSSLDFLSICSSLVINICFLHLILGATICFPYHVIPNVRKKIALSSPQYSTSMNISFTSMKKGHPTATTSTHDFATMVHFFQTGFPLMATMLLIAALTFGDTFAHPMPMAWGRGWRADSVDPMLGGNRTSRTSPGWQADSDRVPHRDPYINLLIDPLLLRIALLNYLILLSLVLVSSPDSFNYSCLATSLLPSPRPWTHHSSPYHMIPIFRNVKFFGVLKLLVDLVPSQSTCM